jgi:hypothetical protein
MLRAPLAAFVILILASCGGGSQAAYQKAMVSFFSTAQERGFGLDPALKQGVDAQVRLRGGIGAVQFTAPAVEIAQTGTERADRGIITLRIRLSGPVKFRSVNVHGALNETGTVKDIPLEVHVKKDDFGEWKVVGVGGWNP